jgi:hypothetical protein
MMAADLLPAFPVWMARASPQEAARPKIVNEILGFVAFIILSKSLL